VKKGRREINLEEFHPEEQLVIRLCTCSESVRAAMLEELLNEKAKEKQQQAKAEKVEKKKKLKFVEGGQYTPPAPSNPLISEEFKQWRKSQKPEVLT